MNLDTLFLALYFVGIIAVILGGSWALGLLFRQAHKAHRLAWVPLAGLLISLPTITAPWLG